MGNWSPRPARPIPFNEAEGALTAELFVLLRIAHRLRQGLSIDGTHVPARAALYHMAGVLEDRLIYLEGQVDHLSESVEGSPIYAEPDSVPLFRGSSTDGTAELNSQGRAALVANALGGGDDGPALSFTSDDDFSAPGHHCLVCHMQWLPENAPIGGRCPICPEGPEVADGRRAAPWD
jgi:hypothetical protein